MTTTKGTAPAALALAREAARLCGAIEADGNRERIEEIAKDVQAAVDAFDEALIEQARERAARDDMEMRARRAANLIEMGREMQEMADQGRSLADPEPEIPE